MPDVRAKFKCISKTQTESGSQVKFSVVTSGSEENDSFFKFTPYGELNMGTINEEAANKFEVRKEYFLDFTLAE